MDDVSVDANRADDSGTLSNEAERLTALLEQPEVGAPEAPNGDPNRKTGEEGRANAVRSDDETGPADRPVTGEEERDSDPAEGPAIAAPRSWPADMRDAFAKLPGDLQQVIATRENERDTAFNRQVREAVERRQAAEAELAAASTERRQYLVNLNAMIEGLARQTAGEFADIRNAGDLERMAAADPQRYLRWQARRDALQSALAEQDAIQRRSRAEQMQRLQGYASQQRALILEKIPELADPKTRSALQAEMNDYLRSVGFSDQETGAWLDHRYALVIRDALRYRKGQQAAKAATEKKVINLPRMQRPGAGSSGTARSAQDRAAMTRIARYGTTDQQAEALARLLEG